MNINNDTDVPVRNLSGETKVVGSTIRHNERSNDGRWAPRGSRLVRPLAAPSGYVRDAVSGRMVKGPDNSMLFRHDDGLAVERIHRVSPDYSSFAAISSQLDAGQYHLRRKA